MRKHLLFSLIISLCAMSAWAADVSVTEDYGMLANITSRVTSSGQHFQGIYGGTWDYRYLMSSTTKNAETKLGTDRAVLMDRTSLNSEKAPYVQCTTWEGGIKKVSFKYKQTNAEDDGQLIKLQVRVVKGVNSYNDDISFPGDAAHRSSATTYNSTSTIDAKVSSCQLRVYNWSQVSAEDNTVAAGRCLVGPITITPYLLYKQKEVTVGSKQRNYCNGELINNTGDEGSIEYSSNNTSVATVDSETGVITPVSAGDAVITATWSEGVTTTYTLHVVDGIVVENFSKVKQTSASSATPNAGNWEGDLFAWTAVACRRGTGDTISANPRKQATWLANNNTPSSLTTTAAVEGGVKHLKFNWREWSVSKNTTTKIAITYGEDEKTAATQIQGNPVSITGHTYDEDINGASNAALKIENSSFTTSTNAAVNNRFVIENIQITPYLLYTTKDTTINMRVVSDDPTRTFTNSDLIDNTTGDAPTYSIITNLSDIDVDIDDGTGEVTVADRFQTGDIIVQAAWSGVTTTYTLHVLGKTETSASFGENKKVYKDVNDELFSKTVTTLPAGAPSATYSSTNPSVATVNISTGEVTIVGVGQSQIIATVAETENYGGSSDTYNLYVRDNSARIETFKGKTTENVVANSEEEWAGDLFDWKVLQVRRYPQIDTLWNNPSEQGTWIRTHETTANYIQSKDVVEGGIKYLTFYWKQVATESNRKLRLAIFAGDTRVASMEREPDGEDQSYCCHEKFLFGANDVMQSNHRLIIKNESYTDADADGEFDENEITKDKSSRIVIGNIHITPYLLYTNKNCTLDMRVESAEPTRTFTNNELKNNTTGGTIVYSIVESSIGVGITPDGEISATNRFQTGDVTIQAKWVKDEVDLATTTYTLHVLGKTETTASYDPTPKKIGLNGDPTKEITKTAGYDGTITYSSSRPDVVQVVNNELQVVGVGVTTITATLPETSLFSGTSASYVLYVRDEDARKEQFSIVTANGVVGAELTQWAGDLYEWQAQYQVRRKEGDNINEGTETPHLGTSIGIEDYSTTPKSSFLQSKAAVEGGIKHMSFYWAQWGAHKNCTRRIAVYASEDLIGVGEHKNGVEGDEFLMGINHQVKSNEQLIFKNESYMGETYETRTSLSTDDNSSRIVIGVIEITPYLFYSDKAHTMRLGDAPYTHPLINNTGGSNISYSLVPANSEVASINSSTGEVTALKAGEVTIKATWDDEGAGAYTTYYLSVKPKLTASTKVETFPNSSGEYYYVGVKDVEEEQSTWKIRQAGINSNENFAANVAFIRKHRSNDDKQSYIQSAEISGDINVLTFDWNIVGNEPDVLEWDIIAQIKQNDVVKKEIHLLSSEGGVLENTHKRNSGWRSTVLTDINVTGNFIIRFENHSTIDGEYTSGNKARFVIDNVEWKAANDISLADEDDNSTVITENNGKIADVQLAGRTIRTGGYNTLCLPFAVSEEQLKATLGEGVKVFEFTNAHLSATNLDIRFNKVTALEAGKPYLVTVPADVANPVFESVTIDESTTNNIIEGENMRFIGSFNKEPMNETGLYVVANSLYRVENITSWDKTIGACRAYFDVPDGAPAVAQGIRMRIVEEEVATGVEEAGSETVNTVRSEKKLIDGQLIIIRDGKEYNAQGMRIR